MAAESSSGVEEKRRGKQRTFNLRFISLWISHKQSGCFAIEGIRRIGVAQQLREEDFKDIDHVEHG